MKHFQQSDKLHQRINESTNQRGTHLLNRPPYQALDSQGIEYWRQARTIGELPVDDRATALAEATVAIAKKTGLPPIKNIPFGAPVFTAFEGMTRPKCKHHADCALLLSKGDDVSLDYCESYEGGSH